LVLVVGKRLGEEAAAVKLAAAVMPAKPA